MIQTKKTNKLKRQVNSYLDGFVSVYSPKSSLTTFGASQNVEDLDDLDFVIKLAYTEKSNRVSDLDFAESNGKTLSLKICTPYYKGIKNSYYVVCNNVIYSIIDIDETKKELYFYLEEMRELAE